MPNVGDIETDCDGERLKVVLVLPAGHTMAQQHAAVELMSRATELTAAQVTLELYQVPDVLTRLKALCPEQGDEADGVIDGANCLKGPLSAVVPFLYAEVAKGTLKAQTVERMVSVQRDLREYAAKKELWWSAMERDYLHLPYHVPLAAKHTATGELVVALNLTKLAEHHIPPPDSFGWTPPSGTAPTPSKAPTPADGVRNRIQQHFDF